MASTLWTVNTAQVFVKLLTDIHTICMTTIGKYTHAKILQIAKA